jgi:hypothetical protein
MNQLDRPSDPRRIAVIAVRAAPGAPQNGFEQFSEAVVIGEVPVAAGTIIDPGAQAPSTFEWEWRYACFGLPDLERLLAKARSDVANNVAWINIVHPLEGPQSARLEAYDPGDPLASDLSPAPTFGDLPINPNEAPLLKVMEGYAGRGVEAMWDGAPTDFNIREDFPVEALERALAAFAAFAAGRGASIMTITCADAETYENAKRDPEKYDLLRARMGGWTEFFVTMFPAHQAQHERRPFETAEALE